MIRSDNSRLLGLATKVLTQKAVERAHGGWIPEKQRVQQEKQKKESKKRQGLQDGGVPDDQPYDLGQQLERGADIIRGTAQAQYERYGEPIVSGIQELMRPIQEGGGPESYQNPEMVGRALDVVGGMGAGSLLTGPSAAEMNVMRSGMGPVAKEAAAQAPKVGIRAYHGSPYEFEKFDLSKIGTGEGAQAYGYGMYLAEHEPVAEGYRDNLLGRGTVMGGSVDDLPERWQMAIYETMKKPAGEIRNHAIDVLRSKAPPEYADQINDILNNKGYMYEVNINAQPEHFLDWDKQLTEQHPHVQERLIAAMAGNDPLVKELVQGLKPEDYGMIGLFPKSKGSQAYKTLADQIGGVNKASELLNNLGIKGIKYFDAGSRNVSPAFDVSYLERQIAKNREQIKNPVSNEHLQELNEDYQTLLKRLDDSKKEKHLSRNYVVFDPENIEIMRRYAIGGEVEPQHLTTGEEAPPLDKTMEFADKFGGEEIQSPFVGTDMGLPSRSHEQFLSQMDIKPDVVPTTTERPAYVEPKKDESYVADLMSAANMAKQYGASFLDDLSNILSKEKIQKFAESLPTAEENIQSLKDVAGKVGDFIAPPAYERGGKVQNLKNGGRVYLLADREKWADHQRDPDKDAKLVHMEPDEFLDKAQKLEDTKDNRKDIKHWEKKIKKGKKIGPAALYTDGSQDGRHRVEAAKKMGVKKVPVLTWPERGTEPAKEYMKTATKIARTASKK